MGTPRFRFFMIWEFYLNIYHVPGTTSNQCSEYENHIKSNKNQTNLELE